MHFEAVYDLVANSGRFRSGDPFSADNIRSTHPYWTWRSIDVAENMSRADRIIQSQDASHRVGSDQTTRAVKSEDDHSCSTIQSQDLKPQFHEGAEKMQMQSSGTGDNNGINDNSEANIVPIPISGDRQDGRRARRSIDAYREWIDEAGNPMFGERYDESKKRRPASEYSSSIYSFHEDEGKGSSQSQSLSDLLAESASESRSAGGRLKRMWRRIRERVSKLVHLEQRMSRCERL